MIGYVVKTMLFGLNIFGKKKNASPYRKAEKDY